MRTYLFSYYWNGSKWSLELEAESQDDAFKRLYSIQSAQYDGELMASIPVSTWFGRIVEWWKGL